MKLIILLSFMFTATFAHASKEGDEKALKDLQFDVVDVEIDTATAEGASEYCPSGQVHWKNVEDQQQFWIGERFYLMNFNAGEIRIQGEDEPGCYRVVKTDTQNVLGKNGQVTRSQQLYCRSKLNPAKTDKVYDSTTTVRLDKKSILFTHEYSDFTSGTEQKGKFKCDLKKVEAVTADTLLKKPKAK